MSDELRDEYQLDYRKAKPNRFASLVKSGGVTVPAPSEPTADDPERAEAELSDEQKQLLEQLYSGVTLSVDDLPYTPEMDDLHRDFVTRSGLALPIRDVFRALKNLGRQGRLGGKFR